VNTAAILYNFVKDELLQSDVPISTIDMCHRTIDQDSSEWILDDFTSTNSTIRCLFSTVAFDMGIQITDVRIVIHWWLLKTVLSYWQEIGRAGRDGEQFICNVLYLWKKYD
jgi:ATP-dependent DNA helicase RecQ